MHTVTSNSWNEDWSQRAACLEVDPELFFPVGSKGPALRQEAEAKAVCDRCPVRRQCLAYALDAGQLAGVWGGTNEDERGRARRRRSRAAAAGRT
ncbi:WhiB family transcriptional regulator [Streptomyces sp. NPDC001941]|uniref:WhiB family transcriptional regulator n=1 Tax=Streptomyces sp. NPDC001941 TaxID=3154659 RepID=UPI00331FCD20